MYQVFLGKVLLPIAPSKIEISSASRNEVIDLINGSQVSIIKQSALQVVNLDFELPSRKYPFVSEMSDTLAKLDEGLNIAKQFAFGAAGAFLGYVGSGGSLNGAASGFWKQANYKNKLVESGISLATTSITSGRDSYLGISAKFLNYFETLKESKMPFQFIVTRNLDNISLTSVNPWVTNMKVTIEDFTINENAENGMDINIQMTLRRYVKYSTKILKSDGTVQKTRE